MSAQNVTVVVSEKPVKATKAPKATKDTKVTSPNKEVVAEPKEKKPRTPTLLAKYSKFIHFSFFLLQQLKDENGNIALQSEDVFLEKIHLFDTVENQQAFVQGFLDDSKDIGKTIRKMNVDKKRAEAKAAKAAAKPPKAPKAAKEPKAPKEPKAAKAKKSDAAPAEEVLQPAPAAKQPKGKAKKADVDPFVAELVNLATNTEAAAPAKAEKPKRKYNKKAAAATEPVAEVAAEEEAELDVSVFEFEGKQYLQDDTGRVFDSESHALIGNLVDGKVVLN